MQIATEDNPNRIEADALYQNARRFDRHRQNTQGAAYQGWAPKERSLRPAIYVLILAIFAFAAVMDLVNEERTHPAAATVIMDDGTKLVSR